MAFRFHNEIRINGSDEKARENLSQYIARPPLSLKKIFYEPFKSKILFKTKYNYYFKENVKIFDAEDFIANLTLHLPPKNVQYIGRYGLYASRTRGIWISMPKVVARAPHGWKNEHLDNFNSEMRIISVIMDPGEIKKILHHLVKIGRSPPGINTARLN